MTPGAALMGRLATPDDAVGTWMMSEKKQQAPIRDQNRYNLPGVGVVRVNIDKHVQTALKQQSHDITKFGGTAKRKDLRK